MEAAFEAATGNYLPNHLYVLDRQKQISDLQCSKLPTDMMTGKSVLL